MFLYVDFPRFDFPVVFSEPVGTVLSSGTLTNIFEQETQSIPSASTTPASVIQTPIAPVLPPSFGTDPHLWAISDPDILRENPVEDKHRRLVRSHRSSPYDRELKPNAKIRDELGACVQHPSPLIDPDIVFPQEILNYPPSQPLTSEEKDLIWKFRFYLTREKRGLTKFLKSVTWRDPTEVKQAVEELLPVWTEIDTDDALELLGPGTVDSRVRAFAVKQLSRADDEVSVDHTCAYTIDKLVTRS